MNTAIALILACNLADWALTLDAIALGIAREGNPIGAAILAQGTPESFAIKVGVVGVACAALWLLRGRRWAVWAASACAAVYVAVLVWHCAGRLVCL